MYRGFLIGFCLCWAGSARPATPVRATGGAADEVIIRVPGTRVSLAPPPHFGLTRSFRGLLRADGKAVIQIYDLWNGNFYKDGLGFTKDAFEKKGAKVLSFSTFRVDGYPARLCSMEGDSARKILALLFGDSTFSATLIGVYPDTADTTGLQIRECFASITYDKFMTVSPFETAPFQLDTSGTPLRFAAFHDPFFVYTLDGKEPGPGSPFFTVTPYPRKDSVSLQDISDDLLARAMENGLHDPVLKNISMDSLGPYEAYEVEVYGDLGDQRGVIYQLLVSAHGTTLVLEGVANGDFDENVKRFRDLARTIRIL